MANLHWLMVVIDEAKRKIDCEPVKLSQLERLAMLCFYCPQMLLLNQVRWLTLGQCFLAESEIEDIADYIRNSEKIKTLQIVGCKLSALSCERIASAIVHTKSEDLCHFIIIKGDIQVSGAKALTKALTYSRTLYEINIYDETIEEEGALALVEAVYMAKTFRFLTFYKKFEYVLDQLPVGQRQRVFCIEMDDEWMLGKTEKSTLFALSPLSILLDSVFFLRRHLYSTNTGSALVGKFLKKVSDVRLAAGCSEYVKQRYKESIFHGKASTQSFSQKQLVLFNEQDISNENSFKEFCSKLEEAKTLGYQTFSLNDIAIIHDNSLPSCILVEGLLGVGKSTFALTICKQWAENEVLLQYDLVLLLQYNEEYLINSKSLEDVLAVEDKSVHQQIIEYAKKSKGYRILVILDGIERSTVEQRAISHPLELLLRHHSLPYSTILVTIDSNNVLCLPDSFHERIEQHIYIHGTDATGVHKLIEENQCFQSDDNTNLQQIFKNLLQSCHFALSVMAIPHFSKMILEVFTFFWENDKVVMPATITELYSAYVKMLTNKNSEVFTTELLERLASIAYESIQKKKYVFQRLELPRNTFQVSGVVGYVEKKWHNLRRKVLYKFIDPTMQDYLAALHMSKNQLHDAFEETSVFPLSRIFKFGSKEIHSWYTLLFFSGLTKLNSEKLREAMLSLFRQEEPKMENLLLLIMVLYEAGDPNLFSVFFQKFDDEPEHSYTIRSPSNTLEAYLYGYSIAHSHPTASWIIDLGQMNRQLASTFMKGLEHSPVQCSVKKLAIKFDLACTYRTKVFDLALKLVTISRSLHIIHCCLDFNISEVHELIKRGECLEEVRFTDNNSDLQFNIVSTAMHPCGSASNNKVLSKFYELVDKNAFTFTLIAKKVETVESVLSTFVESSLYFKKLINSLIIYIGNGYFPIQSFLPPNNEFESILLIGHRPLFDNSSQEELFCRNLKNVFLVGFYWPNLVEGNIRSLTTLILAHFVLTDVDAISLSKFLQDTCTLQTLYISCENKGVDDLLPIFFGLSKCVSLCSFSYTAINLHEDGAIFLSEQLKTNRDYLVDITIIDSTITEFGANNLVEILDCKDQVILTMHWKYKDMLADWKTRYNEQLHFI